MARISVITINYNNAAGLEKTMRSVTGQVEAEPEYIVIDGGSTDGSREIIQAYAHRLSHWVSEKDRGIYHAMNKGIRSATGEFLLFLNSGDFLCHDRVLKEVCSYGLDKDIVYGNMRINWGNNRITAGKMPEKITVGQMYTDTLWHPVSFIRKTLFDRFGFYDETYKMVADYEFFFKVIIAGQVSTKHIPVEICEYNTEGLSSAPEHKETERRERARVIRTYLSPAEIREQEEKIRRSGRGWRAWLNFFKR
jgi:glycosyltransferase involved in cell wall biosynthesis